MARFQNLSTTICYVHLMNVLEHTIYGKYAQDLTSIIMVRVRAMFGSYSKASILTDFKNATLNSLYIFQNTVVCKIPLL